MYERNLEKICDKAGIERISMTMDLYVHVTENEKHKEMQKFEESYNIV